MEFLAPELQTYIDAHTEAEPPLLQELYRQTWLKIMYPRMCSGHLQGRVLSMFSKIIGPKQIIEVGTYTGYSAICLAEGLQTGGQLHTIDVDPEVVDFARGYFEKAGLSGQIVSYLGDSLEIIPTIDATFDLAFIDAKKEDYLAYYEAILPKLRTGGVILTDNVLWSGQVVDNSFDDSATVALRNFNKFVTEDERVENVLLPIRDGIMFARKK